MVWSEGKAENETLIDTIYQKCIETTYCSRYVAQSSSYVRFVDSHVRCKMNKSWDFKKKIQDFPKK